MNLLFFVCFSLVLATVVKPSNDKRDYATFALPSGLRVLVISDPTAETAAAAMDVAVGSLNNPPEVLGLAHFLEHMLFLGTSKYPDLDTFSEFLASAAGSDNAFTSGDHTNYMFDVSPEGLHDALDIWAQFFIAPLFEASATSKELNAVAAEHQKNLRSDPWRNYALLKHVADPASPFHMFSTGSKATLETNPMKAGVDVREKLMAFHEKHYVASNMRLCVLGREPVDQLRDMVSQLFAAVSDGPLPKYQAMAQPFPEGSAYVQKLVRVVPVENARTLSLAFQLPPLHLHRDVKPLDFLGHLLGHEGRGSLLSVLRAKGWALGVGAAVAEATKDWAVFTVDVELTETGVRKVEQVSELAFDYIGMLRAASKGALLELWSEWTQLQQTSFNFADRSNPFDEVSTLAGNMQEYEEENYVRGPAVATAKAGDDVVALIVDAIGAVHIEQFNMFVSAPEMAAEGKPNAHEEWYDFDYRIDPLDGEVLMRWKTAMSANSGEFQLPSRNPYVTADFSIPSTLPDAEKIPTMIDSGAFSNQEGGYELWHVRDPLHLDPKSALFIELLEPASVSSLPADTAALLWNELVLDQLQEQLYDARLAGLEYDIVRGLRGNIVTVSGFTEKLPLLLKQVLSALTAPAPFSDRFQQVRTAFVQSLENAEAEWPARIVRARAPAMLAADRRRFTDKGRLAQLEEMGSETLLRERHVGVGNALDALGVRVYVVGSVARADAGGILDTALKAIGKMTTDHTPVFDMHSSVNGDVALLSGRMGVPPFSHSMVRVEAPDGETNGGISVQLVVSADGGSRPLPLRTALLLNVLSPVLGQQAFTELRTKQQLGYVVWMSAGTMAGGTLGSIQVTVQSSVVSPDEVTERINTFLYQFVPPLLRDVSDADWDNWIQGAIAARRETPKTTTALAGEVFSEVSSGVLDFDGMERDIAIMKTLRPKEARDLWKAFCSTGSQRRITYQRWPVAAISQEQWKTSMTQAKVWDDMTVVDDVDAFRRACTLVGAPGALADRWESEQPLVLDTPKCMPAHNQMCTTSQQDHHSFSNSSVTILLILLAVLIVSTFGLLMYARSLRQRLERGAYIALQEE